MRNFFKFAGALRGARYIEWILLAVALAAAVLLMGKGATFVESTPATDLEERIQRVLSCVQGAGQVRVMVNQEEVAPVFGSTDSSAAGSVVGVVVVAEGARDLRVAMELARAVQTLTGVEASDIEVLTMEEALR